MTLKAELPVFPEGGIYPPLSRKNQNTPPLADKFWQIPPPGNFGHSRCLLKTRVHSSINYIL